jgi:hypothetical protein
MNELDIPYITAKPCIYLQQIKEFEYEHNQRYDDVFFTIHVEIKRNKFSYK